MVQDLLDPKNDYVFKRLFANAPDLLADLINAIRAPESAIVFLEVLNSQISAEDIRGKAIVLDILAEDETGKRYNIEMQVARYPAWSARSLYYLARVLSNQIKSGEEYQQLRYAIGIHLLDFDLFQEADAQHQACWRFEMRDAEQPQVVLGHELQLNIVELRKADRLGVYSKELKAWIRFIEHWQDEAGLQNLAYEPVSRAMGKLREISADEKERWIALSRERAEMDYRSFIRQAKEEGAHQGVEATLCKLIILKFGALPDWAEERLHAASDEQLDRWVTHILSAESLDQLLNS